MVEKAPPHAEMMASLDYAGTLDNVSWVLRPVVLGDSPTTEVRGTGSRHFDSGDGAIQSGGTELTAFNGDLAALPDEGVGELPEGFPLQPLERRGVVLQ